MGFYEPLKKLTSRIQVRIKKTAKCGGTKKQSRTKPKEKTNIRLKQIKIIKKKRGEKK